MAAFTQLRTVAHSADADLAVFQALAPIAKEFGFPEDWRLAPEAPKDLGERPDLDTLGPFRWTPPAAPAATLTNVENQTEPLFTAGNRPRVAVFFLGKGCSTAWSNSTPSPRWRNDSTKPGSTLSRSAPTRPKVSRKPLRVMEKEDPASLPALFRRVPCRLQGLPRP